MPQIIDSFRQTANPLAAAIANAGNTMFADTLTPALKRANLENLQRQQFGIEQLAQTFGGASNGVADPNRAAEMGILGGMKPDDVAMYQTFLTGNKNGPRADATTNAMAGAGKYGDSAENFDLNRKNAFDMNAADNAQSGANNAYNGQISLQNNVLDNQTNRANNADNNAQKTMEFVNKPMETNVNGQPGFARQGDVAGLDVQGNRLPILTGTQAGRQPLNMDGVKSNVMDMWERTQGAFGRQVPVVSGYRDAATNAAAGGAQHSQHLDGNALDIDVSQMPIPERIKLIQSAKAAGFTGVGVYDNSLHFDAGSPRAWGPSKHADSIPSWAADAVNSPSGQAPAGQPAYSPISKGGEKTPLDKMTEFLAVAEQAMPNATPEQKHQWALQQISKSNGISIDENGNVQIGGPSNSSLGGAPTPKMRNDAVAADQAYNNLMQSLGDYEKLVSQTGINVLPGQDSDSINQARTNLQMQMKELYGLGVLNGPDLSLMQQMIFDPSTHLLNPIDNVGKIYSAMGLPGSTSIEDRATSSFAKLREILKTARDTRTQGILPGNAPPASGTTTHNVPFRIVQ